MAVMEFLDANFINTTTMVTTTAGNGSGTVQYLFDKNRNLGYTTVGYTTNTSSVISVVFTTPQVLSHVVIQNHNLRQFRGFWNSVTANSLFNVTSNSATSSYFSFASVTVNSVDLQMDLAFTADTEKIVREHTVSNRRLVFDRNPSIGDWSPVINRKQIVHEMPDGGVKVYNIRDRFRGTLSWEFLNASFTSQLRTVYNNALPIAFIPFPTTTAWDGDAYEAMWIGAFNFKHADNSKTQGQSGSIQLREVAGG